MAAVLGLAVFVVYASVRAFWGSAYYVPDYHYLTPFYSPCVSASCEPGAAHFGVWLGEFRGGYRWQSSRCRSCWGSD